MEFFPPLLKNPQRKEDVIAWISNLPIQPLEKKRVYTAWAEEVKVAVTRADLLRAAPGLPAQEA